MSEQDDLDAMLDGALDEFDAPPVEVAVPEPQPIPVSNSAQPTEIPLNHMQAMMGANQDDLEGMMQMMQAMSDPENGDMSEMAELFKQLMTEEQKKQAAQPQPQAPQPSAETTSQPAPTPTDGKQGIEDALKMLSEGVKDVKNAQGDPNDPLAGLFGGGDNVEDMLKMFMDQMGGGGDGGAGAEQMLESMMKEMVSKDALYAPMKDLTGKFKTYLEVNQTKLTAEQLTSYNAQYQCLTQICISFETEPENTEKVMDLMQQMQAHGNPPDELMADFVPMNGMGGMPGLQGMPDMNLPGFDEDKFAKEMTEGCAQQ